jgi:general stress protein YciG
MPGTRAGGLKAAATIKARRPNFYAEIGSEGGKNGKGSTFSEDPELAKQAALKSQAAQKKKREAKKHE